MRTTAAASTAASGPPAFVQSPSVNSTRRPKPAAREINAVSVKFTRDRIAQ